MKSSLSVNSKQFQREPFSTISGHFRLGLTHVKTLTFALAAQQKSEMCQCILCDVVVSLLGASDLVGKITVFSFCLRNFSYKSSMAHVRRDKPELRRWAVY